MIEVKDSETGAILYKKEPREKKVDELLQRVSQLESQVRELTEILKILLKTQ